MYYSFFIEFYLLINIYYKYGLQITGGVTIKERLRRIKTLILHRKEFRRVEKEVLGKNTIRGITHDLGKLIMYFLPFKISYIRSFHKKHARHHNAKTRRDYIEKMIDYECARFTKSKSTMTAVEYTKYKYNNTSIEYKILMDLLKEFKLI